MLGESHSLLVNLAYLLARPTGTSTYALGVLPYLQELSPLLLTTQAFPHQACYPIPDNLTAEQGASGHFRRLIWTQFQLPKLVNQFHSSLIFTPIPEAPLFSSTAHIVTVHDLIPLRFPKKFSPLTPYFKHYVPQVALQAKQVICDSLATARDLNDFFNVPAAKITPIPLAYDAKNFQFLDLPTQNYFLYLGRRETYKNLGRLIAAFAQLPNRLGYELWIAGPPDPRQDPALIAQIEELNLTQCVKFLDYVPYADLPSLINQAIALVFPSLWEGFGLPVLEAMACGTPVITSNVASLPEVAGDAAMLVDPYQTEAIAAAMHHVATDAKARSQLRQAGLARAQQFTWAKTGAATREVLKPYL